MATTMTVQQAISFVHVFLAASRAKKFPDVRTLEAAVSNVSQLMAQITSLVGGPSESPASWNQTANPVPTMPLAPQTANASGWNKTSNSGQVANFDLAGVAAQGVSAPPPPKAALKNPQGTGDGRSNPRVVAGLLRKYGKHPVEFSVVVSAMLQYQGLSAPPTEIQLISFLMSKGHVKDDADGKKIMRVG